VSRARFVAAARLEFLAEVIYYSEVEGGLGARFAAAVDEAAARAVAFPQSGSPYHSDTRVSSSKTFRSPSSTGPSRKASLSLRSRTMLAIPIIGDLAYVPANHRIDTDRFGASHAGR
jgi:hypothetical protein